MAAPKGHPRYGGRTKGTPNKMSRAVRASLVNAYVAIGDDKALAEWAKANPTEFYKLWGRLIPHEIEGPGPDGELVIAWKS